jgi:uncharacterized membrane protein
MGPALCGIYVCLFRRERGRPVVFAHLFRGFDYFLNSFIATLIQIVPLIVIMLVFYLLMFGAIFGFAGMAKTQPPGQGPGALAIVFPVIIVILTVVLFAVVLVITTLFLFSFPLIVERELTGVEAVKLSARAVLANFGGVLGLVLLNALLSMVGALACLVGAYFLIPLYYAAILVAYRQIFPKFDSPPSEVTPTEAEPPPLPAAPG